MSVILRPPSKKPNPMIIFTDIHLLLGAIPAFILPAFGFIGSFTKLRNAEAYNKCLIETNI